MTIRTRRHQEVRNIATRRSTLNKGEIMSKVGKPCTLIGANRVGKVTYPMRRMRKTCNVKLMSWKRSYVARGGGEHHLNLSLLLGIQGWYVSQVAKSPFTRRIEGASLPRRFNQPTFSLYNGRTDPVEHVSHFNQKMAVHSKDEALTLLSIFYFILFIICCYL